MAVTPDPESALMRIRALANATLATVAPLPRSQPHRPSGWVNKRPIDSRPAQLLKRLMGLRC